MNNNSIYIAGPITNGGLTPMEDAIARFKAATIEVATLGYTPVSPLEINPTVVYGVDQWREVMKLDIRTLIECTGIYLLRGWENSRGARLEKLIADGLDMVILYQGET